MPTYFSANRAQIAGQAGAEAIARTTNAGPGHTIHRRISEAPVLKQAPALSAVKQT